eukprot:3630981-Amphidinium_carterae.1
MLAFFHPLLWSSLLAKDAKPTTGPACGSPSGDKGTEVAVVRGHFHSPSYLPLHKESFLQENEVVPHGKKPFSPAPSSSVASAHQGPWVFGFTNPDHGLPAMPAQPGVHIHGSALEISVDNKRSA